MSALAISDGANQVAVTTITGLWRKLGVLLSVAIPSLVFKTAGLESEEECHKTTTATP